MTPESVERILRSQGMPAEEVHALLRADDPMFVRRTFELHRERLIEWLACEQRLATVIERALARSPGLP